MMEVLGYFTMAWFDPWLIFPVAIGTFAGIAGRGLAVRTAQRWLCVSRAARSGR